MSINNDDFKHQVKMANPLETVVSRYVPNLKRSGRNYIACCPFHSEKTPSFHINVNEGFYKCFGCGESGDVFSFIMKMENLTFIEALKFLAEKSNIPIPNWDKNSYHTKNSQERDTILSINREAAKFFYIQLKDHTEPKSYLKNRQLSGQTALRNYKMGYAPHEWWILINYLRGKGFKDDDIVKSGLAKKNDKGVLFSFFRDRIIIPILDTRGNVIAFGGRLLIEDKSQPKYLNSPDTPVFKKSENLFSLNIAKNNIPNDRTLLLAEGYMDVIALYQGGFKNAVATLGTSLTVEQVKIIQRYADNVIICYDNDNAGIKATNRAIGMFLKSSNKDMNIKVLQMTGAKDPDEYIKLYGSDKFKLVLNQSVDAIDFQLDEIRKSLNLNTNSGKIEMLKRSTDVLAQIQNEASREVYISSIAKECNIEPKILSENIKNRIKSSNANNFHYYKDNINNYGNNVYNNRNFNEKYVGYKLLSNYGNISETRKVCEEHIIACISIFFDLIPNAINSNIKDNLTVYKNIFMVICNHSENLNSKHDISVVHDDLTDNEFQTIVDIKYHYTNIINKYEDAKKELNDCINRILDLAYQESIIQNGMVDLYKLKSLKQQQFSRIDGDI